MPGPKLYGVGTKANFKRTVAKSFSYRYDVASAAGPDGAPEVRSIIETRYRGRAASWKLARSMVSPETWTLNGSFLAPDPENPFVYPEVQEPHSTTVEAPPPEVTEAAKAALLARAAKRLAPPPEPEPQPEAKPEPQPKPKAAPTTPPPARTGPTTERVVTFGRPTSPTTSRKAG